MRTGSAALATTLLGTFLALTPVVASSDVGPTGNVELSVETTTNVPYLVDADGITHALSVHAPTDPGPWPTVVMIHGGGGVYGEAILDPWARAVAAEGAVVFVPRWASDTLPQEASTALALLADVGAELACAVRFARSEAERYGGDPSELALFGHSAGGQFASIITLTDPEVPPGCLAESDTAVPDALVLFEGDWLLHGHPAWDSLIAQDQAVWAAQTPWAHLADGPRLPVTILDSNDASLAIQPRPRIDESLALRDPGGRLSAALEEVGALADGRLTETEAQQLLADELVGLGYRVSLLELPESTHERLSETALAMLTETLVSGSVE